VPTSIPQARIASLFSIPVFTRFRDLPPVPPRPTLPPTQNWIQTAPGSEHRPLPNPSVLLTQEDPSQLKCLTLHRTVHMDAQSISNCVAAPQLLLLLTADQSNGVKTFQDGTAHCTYCRCSKPCALNQHCAGPTDTPAATCARIYYRQPGCW
jgi:hypothetical protein